VSNSGGGDASFVADEDVTGGGTDTSANAITTAGVANAAPMAVYQSERAGTFTYTIPGLVAGSSHTVLLHFAEFYWTAAGKRVFNVAINGTTVLSNFDIYATAGANKALVEQFTATANSSGQIVISFTNGTADQPKASGIEIR
jgi:Malectin domain